MKKIYIVSVIVSLYCISCTSMPKGGKEQIKLIELREQEEGNQLIVYNEIAKLSFNINDIKELIKGSNNTQSLKLLEYINSEADPIIEIPQNNLQLESDYQEAIFPLIKELLLRGDAEIINIKDNTKIKEIIFISSSGLSGKQESFKFKGGDIFYTKVLTLGE